MHPTSFTMKTEMGMGTGPGNLPEALVALGMSSSGTLDSEQVAALEALAQEAQRVVDEKQRALDALAGSIEQSLVARMARRSQKEAEWNLCQDLYYGSLAEKRTTILFPENTEQRQLGNKADRKHRHNIVRPKVNTVYYQLCAAQFGGGERNWSLSVPKEGTIDTEADPVLAMKKMEGYIETQLEESDYQKEYKQIIFNGTLLGTGIIKGPVNLGKLKKIWVKQQDPQTGAFYRTATLVPEYVPCLKSISPWHFYPDDSVLDIRQASDAMEIHAMSYTDLEKLKKHPGYIYDAVCQALEIGPKEFVSKLGQSHGFANSELFRNRFMVIERHGTVDRDCLCNLGIDLPFTDKREKYWSEVWVCNGKIIRIELSNLETADSVPYGVWSIEKDPSSIFGFGLPLLVEDPQRVVHGLWNAIVWNAKLTSGPQVGINRAHVKPMRDGSHDIEPWKVWAIDEYGADIGKAIQFFDVPNRQQELANALQMAKSFADEEASLPPLMSGQEGPQLTSGATGMAMIYKTATSMLHGRAEELDDYITGPGIQWMYDWNMQYNPDESAKGTFEVDVRSSTAVLRQHMELINLEKIIAQASQNPDLAKVIKMDEAAKVLVSNMMLPGSKIVRTPEEIAEYEQKLAQQQAQQPDPALLKVQIEQQRVQLEQQKLELENMKLRFEMTHNQQRAVMDFQERQEANDARVLEAQAGVMKEKLERDAAMIQFAARQQLDYDKLAADIELKRTDQAIQEFQMGAKAELDAAKIAAHEKEMQLRVKTGSGV